MVFSVEVVEERLGFVLLRLEGPGAFRAFQNESGGHRWQRIPPTEKRGRTQTSTIAVAVLREPDRAERPIRDADLDWETTRGSGPGGQHRNKVETAVVVTHRPSGLSVRCDRGRSQHQNREVALALLRTRLLEGRRLEAAAARNAARQGQLGSGMRGDKRRTIRPRREPSLIT